jgi:hypothetical protein
MVFYFFAQFLFSPVKISLMQTKEILFRNHRCNIVLEPVHNERFDRARLWMINDNEAADSHRIKLCS